MAGLMTIDPGLQGTGIAIWKDRRLIYTTVLTSRGAESYDWIDRVNRIAVQVQELAMKYQVREIVSEFMEMHQSARAQMMWKSGDFQRTLFLIGAIYGLCESFVVEFHTVTPSRWKGQLPKSVTIRRVKKILGPSIGARLGIETHAWDAVGIGLWHQGIMK